MHSKNVEKFGGALNVLEIDMDSNEKRKFRKRWQINGGESREIRPKIKNKDLVCIAAAAAIERCQFVLGVCLLFLFSFLVRRECFGVHLIFVGKIRKQTTIYYSAPVVRPLHNVKSH